MKDRAPIPISPLAALVGLVVLVGLGVAVPTSASAAPTTSAPRIGPIPTGRPVLTKQGLDVDLSPATGRCGTPLVAHVVVTNKSSKPWKGSILLVGPGGTKTQTFELSASGASAKGTFDVPTNASLDCSKALPPIGVRVLEVGANEATFVKTMRLTSFAAEQGFPQVAPGDTGPWLRRVMLNGTCGGSVTGTMGLHAFTSQPQSAHVKLALAGATKAETVNVSAANVFVKIDAPVDCNAVLPAFDYELLDGRPANGKLFPSDLTFTPAS